MTTFRTHYSPYFEARALAMNGVLKVRWHDWLGVAPPAIPGDIDLADKVEGMMLGLAIGDSLGNTTESCNPADRRALHGWIEGYMPNRHAEGQRVGLPSDDSQLAFWTLEHLVDHGRLEPQLLGNAMARSRIFGIGQAVREWLAAFKRGTPWHCSGTPSAGNGALMRIAPVLIPHLGRPNCDLWADTLLAAHLTHDDELSNVSCVALVDALWMAIGTTGRVAPRWWLDRWLVVCDALGSGAKYAARSNHPPGFEGSISELVRGYVVPALERQLEVSAAGEVWHSGAFLLETVPTVLYILEKFGNDPREAILQAVNQTRDNDTVAAIVGAAVGALHGAAALPKAWVEGLSGRTRHDDDHRAFAILADAGRRFGYGATYGTLDRAALYRPGPRAIAIQNKVVKIPKDILADELWFKIVDFLQQNWALIDESSSGNGCTVFFFHDMSGVFDRLSFSSVAKAEQALRRNGFARFAKDKKAQKFINIPDRPLHEDSHPNGPIYSSGKFWH